MDLSVILFLVLLGWVALARLIELAVSRRHERQLRRLQICGKEDRYFPWMVALHSTFLILAAAEVLLRRRPFLPLIAAPALALFILATALRWWAIASLGAHWNVHVMDSAPLGIIATGPFRWIRHPNYLGVFVEMAALPLVHTAFLTAAVAIVGNILVLRHRLRIEEPMLEAHPQYRASMSGKPRFFPGLL